MDFLDHPRKFCIKNFVEVLKNLKKIQKYFSKYIFSILEKNDEIAFWKMIESHQKWLKSNGNWNFFLWGFETICKTPHFSSRYFEKTTSFHQNQFQICYSVLFLSWKNWFNNNCKIDQSSEAWKIAWSRKKSRISLKFLSDSTRYKPLLFWLYGDMLKKNISYSHCTWNTSIKEQDEDALHAKQYMRERSYAKTHNMRHERSPEAFHPLFFIHFCAQTIVFLLCLLETRTLPSCCSFCSL